MAKEFAEVDQQIVIPARFFVYRVDLDAQEPYCVMVAKDTMTEVSEKTYIPKALAYYLSTHFCGSEKMRETIRGHTKHEVYSKIHKALGIRDEK